MRNGNKLDTAEMRFLRANSEGVIVIKGMGPVFNTLHLAENFGLDVAKEKEYYFIPCSKVRIQNYVKRFT